MLSPIRDEFRIPQKKAAFIAVAITVALGIPSALSFCSCGLTVNGVPFLDFVDLATGSGVVIVAGIVGTAIIAWLLPRDELFGAMNAPVRRFGPFFYSAGWMIQVGRYLPLAVLAILLLGWLL